MRLYRRKRSPFWYGDLRSEGFGQISTGEKDIENAKQAIWNFLSDKGIIQNRPDSKLDDLIQRFLAYSKANHSHKTYQRNENVLDTFSGYIGNQLIYGINPEMIEKFKIHRLQTEKRKRVLISPSTVIRDLAVIRSLFSRAVEWQIIDQSPMRFVKKPQNLQKEAPKVL